MDTTQVLLKLLDIANPLAGMAAEFIAGKMGLSDKTVDAVKAAVSGATGEDLAKLEQVKADLQKELARLGVQLDVAQMQTAAQQVESVNKTLQTEAMGGSWLQRNHHAIESMMTTGMVGAIYFVLPMMKIPVPSVPEAAFLMLGGVLGVTAWQRGAANREVAKQ